MVRFAALSLFVACALAVPTSLSERSGVAYYNPAANGGSMLDVSGSLGEPLNVIISGLSSPSVLASTNALINYARAIGFSTECFGIHIGTPQTANLGDGQGQVNQLIELRQDYGSASLGTCLESVIGGNHFRAWQQSGSLAPSDAWFLAVSKEEPATQSHNIVPDGYDIGRDALVSGAVGTHSFGGVTYTTTAQNVTGLLSVGSAGINHGIALDGIVTVLTVTAS
ncbi:hypothetical protein K488DRAFT_76651 [Vararia minispora EC-137]|uniref:Uncharacterized protein n=1 Tax=Vararia minispora EC-137 TaxID=1314806 RepID=A0ACB8QUH4_9AGAM|nr:hypothetical protein K488DRAFT_76651 [Vararia minispora EC-137]